jgi:hypothetical protein
MVLSAWLHTGLLCGLPARVGVDGTGAGVRPRRRRAAQCDARACPCLAAARVHPTRPAVPPPVQGQGGLQVGMEGCIPPRARETQWERRRGRRCETQWEDSENGAASATARETASCNPTPGFARDNRVVTNPCQPCCDVLTRRPAGCSETRLYRVLGPHPWFANAAPLTPHPSHHPQMRVLQARAGVERRAAQAVARRRAPAAGGRLARQEPSHGSPPRSHGSPPRSHGSPPRSHGSPPRSHGSLPRSHGSPKNNQPTVRRGHRRRRRTGRYAVSREGVPRHSARLWDATSCRKAAPLTQ